MLPALPTIDRRELFARLARGHAASLTVVTSGRRLAQDLARAFDASQSAGGLTAWESADILSFEDWVARFWDDALYSEAAARLPLMLTAAQEQLLWEECIEATHGKSLLSVSAAADQAKRSWALAHEWRFGGELAQAAQQEDARAFVDWSTRYARLTRERGQTDMARLPDLVGALIANDAIRKPACVALAGFDLLPPRQAHFLTALQHCGATVMRLAEEGIASRRVRVTFDTGRDELEAAARWARKRLQDSAPRAGAIRIGVVVPDLSRLRPQVERIFMRAMEPCCGVGDAPLRTLPFNISLGLPLDAWPLVHDALALLRLAGRPMAFEEASRLLRSPFLSGAESERTARDAFDAALRGRGTIEMSLDSLVRVAGSQGMPPAPVLIDGLRRLADFRRSDLFTARTPGEWARAMGEALRRVGFPGERPLDSVEFQVLAKWHEALAEFATLDRVTGKIGYVQACQRIARIAAAIVFQPESADVPIQVLGALESAGLRFDHLWVAGMTDEAWPMPPRPDPFIPVALQRKAGVPHADAVASLALDERITAGWKAAAGEVVFSHARMKDDSEIGPSPLVESVPEVEFESLGIDGSRTLVEALHDAGVVERIADGAGPAIDSAQQPGGTGLFRDQAACPFRAFARYRLDSSGLESPQPGLDAADRGTLLHEMLACVWKSLEEKSRLDFVAESDLDELLGLCADQALASMRRFRAEALSGRYGLLERARLVDTTREWLALERTRGDFRVVATEERRALTFGGVTVKAKLDRLDALGEGGCAILDYKTGAAALSAWLGPRPDDPQLPMYALGGGEDVRAVAFARVKRGEMEFCGFGVDAGLLPGVKTIEASHARSPRTREYANWAALVAGWRVQLEALGLEYASGEARVAPKRGSLTCQQCDQHAVCRVAEKAPRLGAADGDE